VHDRRSFLKRASAGLAGLALAPAHAASAAVQTGPASADLVVLNAKVYTVNSNQPKAEAFAVKNGHFMAVGSSEDIKGLIGKGTESFDARQMTIVPGFIDCHNHAPGETLLYEVLVGNPFVVEFVSIDSIVGKLRARAQQTPPGNWVEGFFYDDTKVKDKRPVNMQDLDQVSQVHPVAVHHRGGHTMYCNSKAFELAKVTKSTPDPPGGTFDRDASGSLNGRVTDRAMALFQNAGTRPVFSEAENLDRECNGITHISKQFTRYGLTSVHHHGGDLFALHKVRAGGDLKHRVSYEAEGKVLEAMIDCGITTGFGDDWIRFSATAEHTVDGSFSERTMAISRPYVGISPPYQGNLTEPPDVLNAWVERVHRAGIQVNCHANGDVAIDRVLTAYERAQKMFPRADPRHKITHCTLINDDLVHRIKGLGVTPALFTTYAYYNSDKFHFYGEDFMERSMAFRTLLDAGIPAAAGSDFSPGPFDPRMGIQGMVTRRGWNGETWGANQRITAEEALRVNTLHGAYNSFEETIKGSITAGKLADFVVLTEDLHTVDQEKIKDIEIFRTVVGGAVMYQA
jgi:predicted amidohydrolase YtcJ